MFRIHFPAVAQGSAAAQPAAGRRAYATGTETILLVEDEDAVRSLVRTALGQSGYTVIEAREGAHALRLAADYTGPIHLVITDVVMPEMGGRELVERLAAQRPELKFLYLSGYTDDAVLRHGVLHAEMAFLQKPFSMAALASKVREVLDAPSS
jgi:CheY-like chemotaxis protein